MMIVGEVITDKYYGVCDNLVTFRLGAGIRCHDGVDGCLCVVPVASLRCILVARGVVLCKIHAENHTGRGNVADNALVLLMLPPGIE